MKTASLIAGTVAMLVVSGEAFAQPCSGPYCPSNPFPPPQDFVANICTAVETQIGKTFTDAEAAIWVGDEWHLTSPENWCSLSEWHDGSFSVALRNQSINKEFRRTERWGFDVRFTFDAVIDCFFDSAYQWRCGYQYSVLQINNDSPQRGVAGFWAAKITNRYGAICDACAEAFGDPLYSDPRWEAYSVCVDDGMRSALRDLEWVLEMQLESNLLPSVNQIANSMLH